MHAPKWLHALRFNKVYISFGYLLLTLHNTLAVNESYILAVGVISFSILVFN